MSPSKSFWKSIPRTSLVGFLLGVFFIFSTVGLTTDIMEMGREPTLRFVLGVFLSGLFAMFYAFTGFVLRKQFRKAFVPALAVHLALLCVLARSLPDLPQLVPMGAADIVRLQGRLTLSGIATMFAIALGYGCFLYSSNARYAAAQQLNRAVVKPEARAILSSFDDFVTHFEIIAGPNS